MKITNASSDDRDIPEVGTVLAGKTVVVSEKLGARLLEQPAIWVAGTKEKA